MIKLAVVVLVTSLSIVCTQRTRYDNYHVYNVKALSLDSLEFLKNIQGSSDGIQFLDGIHFKGQSAFVLVAPHKIAEFVKALRENDVMYDLVETNAQKDLEEEENYLINRKSRSAAEYDWTQYHDLEENYDWLKSLAAKYPNIIEIIEGGKTYEGRRIMGVKLSYKKSNKGIFIESGMHAREWIGPAAATFILNELLTSQDLAVREVAENFDWYIFPHVNPDGYEFTRSPNGSRLWRTTRSKQTDECFGVDPNRNWDFHWAEIGVSENPCSETFPGKYAFSEIETKTLSEYIRSLKGKIQLYVSFHSYSQLILFPYGHSKKLPNNFKDYQQIFNVTQNAFAARYGTNFTGGNVYEAIYPAAGGSFDWVYGNGIVKLAFTFELRPSSSKFWIGFQLPPKQIVPASEETLDAMVAMINEARKLNYFE